MSRAWRVLVAVTLLTVALVAAPVSTTHPTDVASAGYGYIYNSPISGGTIYAKYTLSMNWTAVHPGQSVSTVSVWRTSYGQSADYVILGEKTKYTCHSNTYCLVSNRSIQVNRVYVGW